MRMSSPTGRELHDTPPSVLRWRAAEWPAVKARQVVLDGQLISVAKPVGNDTVVHEAPALIERRMRDGCGPVGAAPSFAIIRQRVPDGQSIASIWSTVLGTVISRPSRAAVGGAEQHARRSCRRSST